MAYLKGDSLYFYENPSLQVWIENFYLNVVNSNFVNHLHKYKKVFDLLSILLDISKFHIPLDKEKLLNKLINLEIRWSGNEFSIKDLEMELKKVIFELKEEKIDYKILILFSEIKHQNIDQHSIQDFIHYKNELIEKITLNSLTKFEKKIAVTKLENYFKQLTKNH